MSSFRTAHQAAKGLLIFFLLFSSTLVSIGSYSAHAASPDNVPCNPTTYMGTYIGTCDGVSPGQYSQKLGVDFPNFAAVKLSYPTGAILTNSTGDLLFNVTLNPLMLNPLSAKVGAQVQVWGTGFSSGDAGLPCSLSGNENENDPVGSFTCNISGSILTGSFTVANVKAGVYTVIGKGDQGDFSSNTFIVGPPSLVLTPSFGPIGTTVLVSGASFLNTDTCSASSITSTPGPTIISAAACSMTNGQINPGSVFTVGSVAAGTYSVTITGSPGGDSATAAFVVTGPHIALTPSSGPVGTIVALSGGFLNTDTCSAASITSTPGPTIISAAACSMTNGQINAGSQFTVASGVAPGTYTVTVTGSDGDSASATFVVTTTSPSITLTPNSGPAGTPVAVTGSGFNTADVGSCTPITSSPPGVPTSSACTITNTGTLTGTNFFVGSVAAGTYSVTVTGSKGDFAIAGFTVTTTSPSITLTPNSGPAGTPVAVTGSGFNPADAGPCSSFTSVPSSLLTATACTITNTGTLSETHFTVGSVAAGTYSVTITGSPGGDSATASFQVLPSTPISAVVSLSVYVPPDFTGLAVSKTWTSFTNDYEQSSISLFRQSALDQVGPNWWKITLNNLTVTHSPSSYSSPLVAHRIFIVNRSQYIRLFQVTSPIIAGRYFFKAFINGQSIGASNFPTLIVKGSRDPAYISGVLRDSGERNASRAGQVITLPPGYGAQVLAIGLDYLGRPAEAQAFINSTADGSYTIFGVAPGTYNITAYAAGYIPTTRPWTVSVLAAQSLDGVDIYMSDSPIVTGTVLSLCDGAPIPWGYQSISGPNSVQQVPRGISVQVQTLTGTLVAQTPINTTYTNPTSTSFVFPTILREVGGLDGRIPQDFANYTSGLAFGDYLVRAYVSSYVQLVEVRIHILNATSDAQVVIPLIRTGQFFVTVHFRNSNTTMVDNPTTVGGQLTVSAYDQEGVLRAQNQTVVPPNSENASIALLGFSRSRTFGPGSLLPQNYGLLPGTYYIVAQFTAARLFFGVGGSSQNLYYQLSTVQATIGLACNANVSISFPIYLAGEIQLTLYPITYQNPPLFENWRYPGANVQVTMEDSNGIRYQSSANQVILNSNAGFRYLNFSYAGILPGNYVVYVQTIGYTQAQLVQVSVRLGANSDVAVYMIEDPVIDLTVAFTHESLLTFINSALPFAQPINNIDATPARVEVFDDRGTFLAANETYIPNLTGATDGAGTDGVATTTAHFVLAGFNKYQGDPRLIWSGFYDTTDGATQNAGSLILYPWSFSPRVYTVRIWIDGYYQLEQLQVTVTPPQSVSVVAVVDRASRISGTVTGPDFFDFARPLSWATITLQPNNLTLTSIIDVWPGGYATSSLDGFFQVWVPEGSYGMGVALAGYSTYSAQIAVPRGSDLSMQIWLDNYGSSNQTTTALAVDIVSAPSSRPSDTKA